MLKAILKSLGVFPIFDNLVSQKWLVVERDRVSFGPQVCVFSVYRILVKLNASRNSGAIWCISNFQQPCVLKMAGLRAKHNLNLYVIQFYVVIMWSLSAILINRSSRASKSLGFLLIVTLVYIFVDSEANAMGICPGFECLYACVPLYQSQWYVGLDPSLAHPKGQCHVLKSE